MTNIIPGNWKLVFRICLWSPKPRYKDRYPSVCTNSPTPGSGFCAHHAKVVGDLGYPTKLRPFLSHCGADPDSFTKEGKKKVTDFIQEDHLKETEDGKVLVQECEQKAKIYSDIAKIV